MNTSCTRRLLTWVRLVLIVAIVPVICCFRSFAQSSVQSPGPAPPQSPIQGPTQSATQRPVNVCIGDSCPNGKYSLGCDFAYAHPSDADQQAAIYVCHFLIDGSHSDHIDQIRIGVAAGPRRQSEYSHHTLVPIVLFRNPWP